jgi:hypothetical protein
LLPEGEDKKVERVFREISRVTNGAYLHFNAGAARQLAELLRAIATFAVGGMTALEAANNPSATQKQFTIRRYGIHQGLRWSFRGWHKNGIKDAASSPAVRTLSNIRPKNNKRRVSRWPRLS